MPNTRIHQLRFASSIGALRIGRNVGIAALALLISSSALQNAVANGDTRTLSFKHLHTGETLTITYKRDGRYDDEALKKLNWELRDWRRNEAIRMDPKVLDAVWELYRDVGATEPIEIICGYRAPATNEMLRKRSSGVARFSQHTLGKAIDLHIPGVSLERQRVAAMRLQRGGVGYYPSSKFIHVDVGNVRHWPRMTPAQLAKVFPEGRKERMASKDKARPNNRLARADIDVVAPKARPTQLAKLSVNESNIEADEDSRREAAPAAKPPAPTKVAVTTITPQPKANPRRSAETFAAKTAPAEKPIQTASADGFVPRSAKQEQAATATPWPLRDTKNTRTPPEIALAYAAVQREQAKSATGTIGSANDRTGSIDNKTDAPRVVIKKTAARLTADPAGTVRSPADDEASPVVTAGMSFDDPWLRAAMFAPSLYTSFTTSLSGTPDYTSLQRLMDKPTATVVMTFSNNPNPDLTCDRFSGGAVVFVSTVTFQHTAALQ